MESEDNRKVSILEGSLYTGVETHLLFRGSDWVGSEKGWADTDQFDLNVIRTQAVEIT